MSIGLPELLIILFIVLLIFGAGRLPEMGRTLGRGVRGFRRTVRDADTKNSDRRKPRARRPARRRSTSGRSGESSS